MVNPHFNGVRITGLNMNRIKTERCDDGKISVHVDVQQNLQNGTFIQINETKFGWSPTERNFFSYKEV